MLNIIFIYRFFKLLFTETLPNVRPVIIHRLPCPHRTNVLTAEKMHMDMKNFLTAIRIRIQNQPETAFCDTFVSRHLRGGFHHQAENLRGVIRHIERGRIVRTRNDHYVNRGLRAVSLSAASSA